MPLAKQLAGVLREVWTQTTAAQFDGGANVTVTTAIPVQRATDLSRCYARLKLDSKVGSPIVGPTTGVAYLTRVNGVLVVRFSNIAAVGNQATYTLECGIIYSTNQARTAYAGFFTVDDANSWNYSDGGTMETVYVNPVTGLDTNDGHSLTSAWQTMGRVATYMTTVGIFRHDLLVICSAGTDAVWTAAMSNFFPENVQFVNGSRLYVTGHNPNRTTATLNVNKEILLTGIAVASSPLDCDHLRLTPSNGELWQDTNAAVNVALVAADVGKTLMIRDTTGAHVTYATVSAVNGQGAAVGNRWIEVTTAHTAFGGVPAWVLAIGTTWTILDPLDPDANQVTAMAGTWNLSKIQASGGASISNGVFQKQHAIAHIRFTSNAVRLIDCDDFAFPGCRFEAGLTILNSGNFVCNSSAVSVLNVTRYFPTAIWTQIGLTDAGTADGYGGPTFFVYGTSNAGSPDTSTCRFVNVIGSIFGMVFDSPASPNQGIIDVAVQSAVGFAFCSFGQSSPASPNGDAFIVTRSGGGVALVGCRSTMQVRAIESGVSGVGPFVTWTQAAINAATDAPALAVADTFVPISNGMIYVTPGGKVSVTNTGGSSIEGFNATLDATAVCIRVDGGTLIATGGHDANWAGEEGWLHLLAGSTGYMTGNRTFSHKPTNTQTTGDVYVYNSRLQCGTADAWVKSQNGADGTPAPFLFADHHADVKHGTPVNAAPGGSIQAGTEGVAGGIDCGALGNIRIDNCSRVTIGDIRVNNSAGVASPSVVVLNNSFLHWCDTTGVSWIESQGLAAGAITNGSIATAGYVPAGSAAHRALYSDYLAAIGTAQGTFLRHE